MSPSGRPCMCPMVFQGLDQAGARRLGAFPGLGTGRRQGLCLRRCSPRCRRAASGMWLPSRTAADGWCATIVPAPPLTTASAGDREQAGWCIHGYQSAWLPADLLEEGGRDGSPTPVRRDPAVGIALHFNKGIAGAPAEALAATRDTAINPGVVDAFAWRSSPAAAARPSRACRAEVDEAGARKAAAGIRRPWTPAQAAPGAGAYVSESDFFQPRWQYAYWGSNYPRLLRVKTALRPGRAVHGPPRRRQRRLERRWFTRLK